VGLLQWGLGCAAVYCSLFGLGRLLFGSIVEGAVLLPVAAACAWGILRSIRDAAWSDR
jgi:hypothetical protein